LILIEALNKLLRDTTNDVLTVPGYAIAARQPNAPRPQNPYASVSFVSDTNIGWEETLTENRLSDDDIDFSYSGLREVMFSVDFYRDSATDNARAVRTGLVRESIVDTWNALGVGLTRRSDVRDISDTLDDTWEERAQFDIFLSVVGNDQDIVRSILSVQIQGQYQENSIYDFTIDVEQP